MLLIAALVGLVVVLVGVVLFLTYGLGGAARPDSELQAAVESALESAENGEVSVLADVTDFEWEAVGVFPPYYPHDAIVEDMGVRVPRSVTNHTGFEESCLLVFRDGDRMVAWTPVSRSATVCGSPAVHPLDQARSAGD